MQGPLAETIEQCMICGEMVIGSEGHDCNHRNQFAEIEDSDGPHSDMMLRDGTPLYSERLAYGFAAQR